MNQPQQKIRVAIVDDHPVVREGLRAFLQMADDIEVVCDLDNGKSAVDILRQPEVCVDVVIMDLKMPGEIDGIEAIHQLSSLRPELRLLALTSSQDDESAVSALGAGAIGYLHKDVPPDLLLGGIRQAASGRMVLEQDAWMATRTGRQPVAGRPNREDEHLQREFSQSHSGTKPDTGVSEQLTEREMDVLQAMAQGQSNKEIGSSLGISEKTVKVHVSHILGKLGVYDRTQAVLLAAKRGLVIID